MEALIVQHGDALGLARALAERQGMSVDDAVVASLRASLNDASPERPPTPRPIRVPALEELTARQRTRYESLRRLVREAAQHRVPGVTSDHDDLYDEHGLPI